MPALAGILTSRSLPHSQHSMPPFRPSLGKLGKATRSFSRQALCGEPSTAAPELLHTERGSLAYHQLPSSSNAVISGAIFCGGLMSSMEGLKATTLDMHARRRGHPYVRFDYSGHGASSGAFLDTTLGDWYQDTLDILDRVALPGQHVLVGSSIGGWIALKAAMARPDRVKAVALVAPAVDVTEGWWRDLDQPAKDLAAQTGFVTLASEYSKEGDKLRVGFFEEARRHLLLNPPGGVIPLACPVRVVHGLLDSVAPVPAALRMAQQLESQDVHLTLIKDGDHRLSRPQDLRTIMLMVEELLAMDMQRMPMA